MTDETIYREPQQKRSIEKKERILAASYAQFCQNGYAQTTMNDIAKSAKVSVGTVYSYFKDKKMIFKLVYETYVNSLEQTFELAQYQEITSIAALEELFIRSIKDLIKLHQDSINFQKETKMLYQIDEEVAKLSDASYQKSLDFIKEALQSTKVALRVTDFDAAAILIRVLCDGVVDQITFYPELISEKKADQLIQETTEMLKRYLCVMNED
ncbi:TetR/AcrR family transcriptional regulator [Isobaculum melis]|uniref:DNA-binding transcriptional regulator, AcrR family n=1 Tax=Isobaculum melis TaxID=142588 RepID=A0A1H9QSH4_9LACT|nr:TetR/AcrR family transcriptional regulator [Isobaculum melis]SER63185.1 DNA-binding transcriptional regulator, AcrR family [Isobaculum melis]